MGFIVSSSINSLLAPHIPRVWQQRCKSKKKYDVRGILVLTGGGGLYPHYNTQQNWQKQNKIKKRPDTFCSNSKKWENFLGYSLSPLDMCDQLIHALRKPVYFAFHGVIFLFLKK